jgi:acyl-CoA thioester hydrolase
MLSLKVEVEALALILLSQDSCHIFLLVFHNTEIQMRRLRVYFKDNPQAPAPLMSKTNRRVRFEEIDALGMVWHGRYPSYFEDGRIAFGDQYGLTYHSFITHQVLAPIVQMHMDYKAPLRFDQIFQIETTLHWNEAMRLDFSYLLRNDTGQTVATGYTVQVLTDTNGAILFIPPDWIHDFREKWRTGFWQNL